MTSNCCAAGTGATADSGDGQQSFLRHGPHGTITAWNPQSELTFGWTRRSHRTPVRYGCDSAYRAAHASGVEQFLTTTEGSPAKPPDRLDRVTSRSPRFPIENHGFAVGSGDQLLPTPSFGSRQQHLPPRRRAVKKTFPDPIAATMTTTNRSSSIEHTPTSLASFAPTSDGRCAMCTYRRTKRPDQVSSTPIWTLHNEVQFAPSVRLPTGSALAGSGLPGCVLASGRPQWIVSLPTKLRSRSARRAALDAGLHFPARLPDRGGEKIIGILEFFSLYTVSPDANS